MYKFEDYEVTTLIGGTGYFCNAIGLDIRKDNGVLHSEYPTVWGWTRATYLIFNERLYLTCEEPAFYA